MIKKFLQTGIVIFIALFFSGCVNDDVIVNREDKIPDDAIKMTPETDLYPPILHSDEYEEPIPVPGSINTAGAEDSPFIPCCEEDTMYFFFTPDVRVPVERQLLDGVTGIYVSKKINGEWSNVERVILQDKGKLSLDGCTFVLEDKMWFCTAREGYTGLHWFTAKNIDGKWSNWENADFDPSYEVGELHITSDEMELYFHSNRSGGKGGTDIWVLHYLNGEWQDLENIEIINTEENEGMPYINDDGSELWFNRMYMGSPAIYRSKNVNGDWQEPELIISQFAGEPTLDENGNIYFVHHYYNNSKMIEADLYVAYRK